jgi:carbonic anhydrase
VHLESILFDIQQSVDLAWKADWTTVSAEVQQARIDGVSRAHVRRTMRRILELSPALAHLAAAGQIKVVGGMYNVRSRAVEFLDPAGRTDAGPGSVESSTINPGSPATPLIVD